MKKQEIAIGLTKMGYRHIEHDVWGKPIGNHLFTFNINTFEWFNHFKALTGDLLIWETHTFLCENENDFLNSLKMYEGITNIRCGSAETNFEFLTKSEQINLVL